MTHLKRILACIGEHVDAQVLRRAAAIAEQQNASLTVLDVTNDLREHAAILADIMPASELEQILASHRRDQLEELIRAELGEDHAVELKVLVGRPFVEIILEVLRQRHDFVVKAAERPAGVRERLFGSTDMHLMRKCPCPIWLMKPAAQQSGNVMAALDVMAEGPENLELNQRILELGLLVAAWMSSELHVFSTWQVYGERTLRSSPRFKLAAEQIDELARKTRDLARERQSELERRYEQRVDSGVKIHWHLRKGDPSRLIPEASSALAIDTIVMGTVGRTGVPGLLIGNTAETVLSQVDCSVVVVKPRNFLTPVR